jgi:hypothetical protein
MRFPFPIDAFETIYIHAIFRPMGIYYAVFQTAAFLFLLCHFDLLCLIRTLHVTIKIRACYGKTLLSSTIPNPQLLWAGGLQSGGVLCPGSCPSLIDIHISRVMKKDWNSHIRAKNPMDVTPAKLVPEVLNPGAGVQICCFKIN